MNTRTDNKLRAGRLNADDFSQFKSMLCDIELNLSVWDSNGTVVLPLESFCDFCRTIDSAGGDCCELARGLAGRCVSLDAPQHVRAANGCCVLGVPIHQKRRVLGAAVTCFPPVESLDEEFLCQLCSWLKLDREVITRQAKLVVRHKVSQAEDFLSLMNWGFEQWQHRRTAEKELENLSVNLATTYEELSLLYRVSGYMRVSQAQDEFLQSVCNELIDVMNIEASVAVVFAHPAGEEDELMFAGECSLSDSQLRTLVLDDLAPRFWSDSRGLVLNKYHPHGSLQGVTAVRNVIATPLVTDDEHLGVLIGMNKSGEFDSVDLKLINAIASQASVFLSNNRLYADLQELLMGVLHALTATIDAKDSYTCGHSQRVALLSKRLAEECGFGADRVQQVYLAGLLHDIGKIGVPEAILCKKGKLTDEEYEAMKHHPAIGAKILGGIRQLDHVITGILNHHERPDGRGYPNGLRGDDVPIEGMILALADGFDAMTSDRTYRKGLPISEAVEEIHRNCGTQFDVELAEKFLAIDLEEFVQEIRRPAKMVFPT